MPPTHDVAALADCVTCGRPVDAELAICAPCLDNAQQTIAETRDYLNRIPETTREVMGLRAIRYDKPPAAGTPNDGDLPFGLNVVYDDPEDRRISAIRQPETALDILHGWAAQHDAGWRDYLTETRQVRNVIRRLAGLNPERQTSPCPECGGSVVQEWTASGLDDALHCTSCTRTWATLGRFAIATASTIAAVPDEHPDLLVTADEARIVLPDIKRTHPQCLAQARPRTRGNPAPPLARRVARRTLSISIRRHRGNSQARRAVVSVHGSSEPVVEVRGPRRDYYRRPRLQQSCGT